MGSELATIAIVPRERFSFATRSLDNILGATPAGHPLIYVDGNSPPEVADHIARAAKAHSFHLIRHDGYLSPNQARNRALAHVRTKYVVFIDNDVLVSPGWIQTLIDCAEATGAWVVGPVYCERLPIAERIHMAGGEARFVESQGRRVFHEAHRFYGKSYAEIRPQLRREPTEQIEFHCVLVRRDVFDRLGPLDERLLSAAEHTDLCLGVRAAGGAVYLEPDSVVTYVPPPPLAKSDLAYYQLRWSHAWNHSTVEHLRAKWSLSADDPGLAGMLHWLAAHRRVACQSVNRALRIVGGSPARWLENHLFAPIEQALNCRRYPADTVAEFLASSRELASNDETCLA